VWWGPRAWSNPTPGTRLGTEPGLPGHRPDLLQKSSRLSQLTKQPPCMLGGSASLCSTSTECQMQPTKAVGVHCHALKGVVSCARQLRQDVQAEAMKPAPTLLDLACRHRVAAASHPVTLWGVTITLWGVTVTLWGVFQCEGSHCKVQRWTTTRLGPGS